MDYRSLDLNLLVVFDALFEEKSVTAVAKRLQMSQPAVSFALKKLRKSLGDELFIRAHNQMQPTPRAIYLHGHVRQVIATIEQDIFQPTTFDPRSARRTFSLSLSDIGELVFLPPLLERLRGEAPLTDIRCLSMPPERLAQAMESGEIDLAIGYFPDVQGTGFYQQRLFGHPFVCLLRSNHPTIGDAISLEQFLEAEHAVVAQPGRSQEVFEKLMSGSGLQRRIRLRSPHYTSLPWIIANSDLITIVPRAVGALCERLSGLKMIPAPLEIPSIDLKQFWHRRQHAEPATQWLRSVVAELFIGRDPTASPSSAPARE
jgi:DNA-binding transcriptional LysR family regulator